MPEYLYRIRPARVEMVTDPTPAEAAIVGSHFSYLQEHTVQGVVLTAIRTLTTGESTFGIIVFRADDEQAARRFMEADPAVREGVMRAELFPCRVALLSETYARE